MTYYQGGKKRIGSEIAQVIYDVTTDYERKNGIKFKGYCEPFCGMLGVYQHIPGLFSRHSPSLKYIAGDRNGNIIDLWKAIQKGYKPPIRCTKTEFERLKRSQKRSPRKTFIGHAASMRGIYFATYFDTNNIQNQQKSMLEIGKRVKKVKFKDGDFNQFSNLKDFIIYCDPPYKNTTHDYHKTDGTKGTIFDTDQFFNWCRTMSNNNLVFISEYTAPKDFQQIWSKGKERLYII